MNGFKRIYLLGWLKCNFCKKKRMIMCILYSKHLEQDTKKIWGKKFKKKHSLFSVDFLIYFEHLIYLTFFDLRGHQRLFLLWTLVISYVPLSQRVLEIDFTLNIRYIICSFVSEVIRAWFYFEHLLYLMFVYLRGH